MAVYMQGSRRRWVIVAVGVVALLVGIGIGYVIGNNTAKTSADVVAESRSKGEDAATALQRLPIEYEQAVSASGESSATITGATTPAARTPSSTCCAVCKAIGRIDALSAAVTVRNSSP